MGIFNSFNNQLQTYSYPKSWETVENILSNNHETKTVLALPWHGYPRLNFAGDKRVANPARSFFSFDIVAGKNLESAFLQETEQKEWDNLIINIINKDKLFDDYKEFLAQNSISHVLVLKIQDWEDYNFLNNVKILKQIFNDEHAIIYKIE